MKKFLIVIGVISALAYATVASALTGFIDPNGDGASHTFIPNTGPLHYPEIDDGWRSPSVPDLTNFIYDDSDSVSLDIYDMTSLTVTSVSNVTIWAFGESGFGINTDNTTGSIYMGGSWTTPLNFNFPLSTLYTGVEAEWRSISFSGTWTQANLDAIQVKIQGDVYYELIYAMYGVVTYTGGVEPPATKAYFIKKKKNIIFIH
jgi:hypothetical protein